jgi:sigma-E factor negative regulatory protein RseA
MTDEQRSQVSALLDGELPGRSTMGLYESIGRERELRAIWERYHLIGQAIRGERIDPQARGLADSVREALSEDRRVPMPRLSPWRRLGRNVALAPFAGSALAAGAAILAVLATPALLPDPELHSAKLSASAVGFDAPGRSESRDLSDKLNLFLVNHQALALAAGTKGMLPYATLVGYDGRR